MVVNYIMCRYAAIVGRVEVDPGEGDMDVEVWEASVRTDMCDHIQTVSGQWTLPRQEPMHGCISIGG